MQVMLLNEGTQTISVILTQLGSTVALLKEHMMVPLRYEGGQIHSGDKIEILHNVVNINDFCFHNTRNAKQPDFIYTRYTTARQHPCSSSNETNAFDIYTIRECLMLAFFGCGG